MVSLSQVVGTIAKVVQSALIHILYTNNDLGLRLLVYQARGLLNLEAREEMRTDGLQLIYVKGCPEGSERISATFRGGVNDWYFE